MVRPTRGLSEASLTTIADMIHEGFGNKHTNYVDFGLIRVVLLIMTRALRLLNRKVIVKVHYPIPPAANTVISLEEIRISAKKHKNGKEMSKYASTEDMLIHETSEPKGSTEYDTLSFSSKQTSTPISSLSKGKVSYKLDSKLTKGSRSVTETNKKDLSSDYMTYSDDDIMSDDERSDDIISEKQTKIIKSIDKTDKKETSVGYKIDKNETIPQKVKGIQTKRDDATIKSTKKTEQDKIHRSKSTDSSEAIDNYREKILVVETRVSMESRKFHARGKFDGTPHSFVTREQFNELAAEVKQLQDQFGPVESDLLQVLYKTCTLSDPMAAIQVSARLEIVERAIDDIMIVLNHLKTNNTNVPSFKTYLPMNDLSTNTKKSTANVNNLPASAHNLTTAKKNLSKITSTTVTEDNVKKSLSLFRDSKVLGTEETLKAPDLSMILSQDFSTKIKDSKIYLRNKSDMVPLITISESGLSGVAIWQNISIATTVSPPVLSEILLKPEELRNCMQGFSSKMKEFGHKITNSIMIKAKETLQDRLTLDKKLEAMMKKTTLPELEHKVKAFAESVNAIDVKMNSQITNIFTNLTSMQNEVETKLENMADALSKRKPNDEAIQILTQNFSAFQKDIDSTIKCQNELNETQYRFLNRLRILQNQLNELNKSKAERDSIEEALKGKISTGMLNGIVNIVHFSAVYGNWQKYIHDLNEQTCNRERAWQNRIDQIWFDIDAKADIVHVNALMDDINNNLTKLEETIDYMNNLLSPFTETNRGIQNRAIINKNPCISCDTQAKGEPNKIIQTSSQKLETKSSLLKLHKRKTDGDNLCYPDLPIPHPVCERPSCVKPCIHLKKECADNQSHKSDLASSIVVRSSKPCDIQRETNEVLIPCKECILSDLQKKIFTSRSQSEHALQPKSRLVKTIKPKHQSLQPHTLQKSKESFGSTPSLRAKFRKISGASQKFKLSQKHSSNYSRGHLMTNSASLISDDDRTEILVMNLDEDIPSTW